MEKWIALLIGLTVFQLGCATYPPSTGFEAADGSGYGYTVKSLDEENSYMAIFKGNNRTNTAAAMAYTVLAGYTYCGAKKMHAKVDVPKDFSEKESYTQVSSYSVPYVSANGTTSYSSHTYSYPVTRTYPNFYSIFICRPRFIIFKGNAEVETIPRELVHSVMKDFRGGILVKSVTEGEGQVFKADDVIVRANGKRVESISSLNNLMSTLSDKKSVKLDVIRKQKVILVNAPIKDITDAVVADDEKTIEELCKYVPTLEEANSMGETRAVSIPTICLKYKQKKN